MESVKIMKKNALHSEVGDRGRSDRTPVSDANVRMVNSGGNQPGPIRNTGRKKNSRNEYRLKQILKYPLLNDILTLNILIIYKKYEFNFEKTKSNYKTCYEIIPLFSEIIMSATIYDSNHTDSGEKDPSKTTGKATDLKVYIIYEIILTIILKYFVYELFNNFGATVSIKYSMHIVFNHYITFHGASVLKIREKHMTFQFIYNIVSIKGATVQTVHEMHSDITIREIHIDNTRILNKSIYYKIYLQDSGIMKIESSKALDLKNFYDGIKVASSAIKAKPEDVTIISSSIEDDYEDYLSTDAGSPYKGSLDISLGSDSDDKYIEDTGENGEVKLSRKQKNTGSYRRRLLKTKLAEATDGDGKSKDSEKEKNTHQPPDKKRPRVNTTEDSTLDENEKGDDKDNKKDKEKEKKKGTTEEEWAKIVKETILVIVKADDGRRMEQAEYSQIDTECDEVLDKFDLLDDPENWVIIKSGISPYNLWYRVGNSKTVDAMKKVIPEIDPPEDADGVIPAYRFQVFGPGETPTFYMNWRISRAFEKKLNEKKLDYDKLTKFLLKKNEPVRKVIDPNTNQERDALIKVKGRATGVAAKKRDEQLKGKKEGTGNISVVVEIEDALWNTIVEQCEGKLKIGTGDGELEGFDIKDHVKMFKDGMSSEERPPRPPTFGGVIRRQKAEEAAAAAAAKKAAMTKVRRLADEMEPKKDEQPAPAMIVDN